MLTRRNRRFRAVVALSLSGSLVVLAGCGAQTTPPAAGGTPEAAPPSTPAEPASASASASAGTSGETGGTAIDSPEPSSNAVPTSFVDRLLPADRLARPTGVVAWAETRTNRREPLDLATCHRFSMLSIGAMRVAVRTFQATPEAPATATHLVAQFADPRTAKRAFAVLRSWQGQCEDLVAGHATHGLGELTPVAADRGAPAAWYLITYSPAESDAALTTFDATGFVRVGDRIAVVVLRTDGTAYDYPTGKEPMVSAVQQAALRLR